MRCFKRILFLFSIGMAFWGCTQSAFEQENSFALQPGDLLFQDLDSGPLCDAIEKVTTGFGGMNFSHVGIAAKDDKLQSFLSRSFDDQHQPKVAVGRLKRPYRHLIPPAIKEANALKAKPYDKVFAIDNDAYYCSELIYEIFLRANNNNPLFSLQPMTFKDPSTGEILSAWKDYFSELSASLPEGQPGINPGGISRSRFLNIIHTYGNPSRNQ
jgi:hypothetical protein